MPSDRNGGAIRLPLMKGCRVGMLAPSEIAFADAIESSLHMQISKSVWNV